VEKATKEAEMERAMQAQEKENKQARIEEEKKLDEQDQQKQTVNEAATNAEEVSEETIEEKDDIGRNADSEANGDIAGDSSANNKDSDESTEFPQWSDVEKESYKSLHNCYKACEANKDCFQYAFNEEEEGSTCILGTHFRLGEYHEPDNNGKIRRKSGWMVQRIRTWVD
jgi:hypothetical protein